MREDKTLPAADAGPVDCQVSPAVGDYVLATKWSDGGLSQPFPGAGPK